MKKYLLMLVSVLALVGSANAQVKDEIQKSRERAAKLETLCADYKTSGNEKIDAYGNAVKEAAVYAVANSVQLENLYKRQIGESKDGSTEVTIEKPTAEEWTSLAATIAGEGAYLAAASKLAPEAVDEAKTMQQKVNGEKNPMKKGKLVKASKAALDVVGFGNDATSILVEESAAQLKAVNEIVKMLQSGETL